MLAIIERAHSRAQGDVAARELERLTIGAFFDHLSGRPVDPRITRQFVTQSSGWRVPWSASGRSNEAENQVLNPVLSPVRDERPVEYARIGAARSLRQG